MSVAGLRVPPAFILPIACCREYLREGQSEGLSADALAQHVKPLEQATGLTFGGERRPLLVSVRSGAAVSMPGMLDTILNVGLCERTLPALVRMTGNPRHAWDSYRRLIQAYGEVVQNLSADGFHHLLTARLQQEGVPAVAELDVIPSEPAIQLEGAVQAVFRSWESARAVEYRRLHHLGDLDGTAATVQAMVFGNMGATSGSGVAFTRDPATGEKNLYMDFLWNSQVRMS